MAEKVQQVVTEKKSSKMLIIIIAVVVLLLGGGGAAYYFMAGSSEDIEQTQEDAETEEEPEAKTDEESGASDMLYYNVSKPLIVNFPRGSSARLIQVSLAFLVTNQDAVNALEKHEPMIRNNLLMLISAAGADDLNTVEGKNKLRDAILTEADSVLEKMTNQKYIKDVFFTAFVMQ